ncbi:LPS-induced tumor necrosis factor alpha factor [Penicillium argentinense]|uniref:LPS-induced tumor necrosis factor alpha factor n=1 Tax=Penicillium argentinense TaxID=1131581 RepID=A0A9W9FEF8_9EURO|nr:LPS-induced tumor necrosis factor alpha factor [Penicillium argentinense]KAJ5098738.1 LPS-induced tumor necrosis factor alpha factor [Penicillium argentinense]
MSPAPHSAASVSTPTEGTDSHQAPEPQNEKSRPADDIAPTPVINYNQEMAKSYQGQPAQDLSGGFARQYPVHAPDDVKGYPGQPQPAHHDPSQQQSPYYLNQPQLYYTPYGPPSGYATAAPLHALQSAPAPVDCPSCGHREITRTEAVTGMTTHGWAAVLCCCCCLGCFPYLLSSLKDVDHYCGKCGIKLACWHNSGRVQVMQTGQNIARPGQPPQHLQQPQPAQVSENK